jgi:hypothetical protein
MGMFQALSTVNSRYMDENIINKYKYEKQRFVYTGLKQNHYNFLIPTIKKR